MNTGIEVQLKSTVGYHIRHEVEEKTLIHFKIFIQRFNQNCYEKSRDFFAFAYHGELRIKGMWACDDKLFWSITRKRSLPRIENDRNNAEFSCLYFLGLIGKERRPYVNVCKSSFLLMVLQYFVSTNCLQKNRNIRTACQGNFIIMIGKVNNSNFDYEHLLAKTFLDPRQFILHVIQKNQVLSSKCYSKNIFQRTLIAMTASTDFGFLLFNLTRGNIWTGSAYIQVLWWFLKYFKLWEYKQYRDYTDLSFTWVSICLHASSEQYGISLFPTEIFHFYILGAETFQVYKSFHTPLIQLMQICMATLFPVLF